MSRGNHRGKCALCRKECDLTFEHIPPKSAFNNRPAKSVGGEEIVKSGKMPWDYSGLHYENLQRGMGQYSLCSTCNNNTGSWYCDEYLKIAHAASATIMRKKEDIAVSGFEIHDFYPLRFVKQVFSMFCSINNFDDIRIDRLREFVLDKTSSSLDISKYKLCMYFTESRLQKLNGLSVHIKLCGNSYTPVVLSEIVSSPLGFILYFDPTDSGDYRGIDITSFCTAGYDEKWEMMIPLVLLEVNSWISEDFRTKQEIEQCVAENKEWEANHECEI